MAPPPVVKVSVVANDEEVNARQLVSRSDFNMAVISFGKGLVS